MTAKMYYRCSSCKKTIPVKEVEEKEAKCCGQPMEKVPEELCTQPAHPEHARPMRDDEPCDDGRAG